MKSPCMNCPRIGCGAFHDVCEEYQAFAKWRAEKLDTRRADGDYRSYKTHVIAKEQRRAN